MDCNRTVEAPFFIPQFIRKTTSGIAILPVARWTLLLLGFAAPHFSASRFALPAQHKLISAGFQSDCTAVRLQLVSEGLDFRLSY